MYIYISTQPSNNKKATELYVYIQTAKEIGNEINSVNKALLNCMAWNLLGEHLLILYCVDGGSAKKRRRRRDEVMRYIKWKAVANRWKKKTSWSQTIFRYYHLFLFLLRQKLQFTLLCERMQHRFNFIFVVVVLYLFTFCFSLINILMNFYIRRGDNRSFSYFFVSSWRIFLFFFLVFIAITAIKGTKQYLTFFTLEHFNNFYRNFSGYTKHFKNVTQNGVQFFPQDTNSYIHVARAHKKYKYYCRTILNSHSDWRLFYFLHR